jgi:gluconolactonase
LCARRALFQRGGKLLLDNRPKPPDLVQSCGSDEAPEAIERAHLELVVQHLHAPQDRQGRLITCEHGARRVTRTDHDGRITVILDQYGGKLLNSPNDVVVKSDGSVWSSDPPFGIGGNYEGNAATPELPQNVYRVDGETGQASAVASDLRGPNGLCFSPDETKLYVVESRATPNRLIRVYDVINGRRLANDRVFVDAGPGTPDGLRSDVDGNLWCGWGMGTAELDA